MGEHVHEVCSGHTVTINIQHYYQNLLVCLFAWIFSQQLRTKDHTHAYERLACE